MTHTVRGPHDLDEVVRLEMKKRLERAAGQPLVCALIGELGAGKSTFTRRFATFLGIGEAVISPTFLLIKSYPIPVPVCGKSALVHVDAYRVASSEEFAALQLPQLMSAPDTITVVEWADRIRDIIPQGALWMSFGIVDEHTRTIEINDNNS